MAKSFAGCFAFIVLSFSRIFPLWPSALFADAAPAPSYTTQTVQPPQAGPITGLRVGPNQYEFLGIPYAQPPTGNNRFASPVPYPVASQLSPCVLGRSHSNASINATAFGSQCPQTSGGDENCLFLNVWTTSVSVPSRKPVMFWIHGGSFVEGSGSDPTFDGTALSQNNVVVVTFNYRLGILGFLDGGSDFPTVNMGLQDTILALTWVQNNIVFFGGDPSRVTVFGESSGATMIRALMASHKARNLFIRAIMQSDPQNYPFETRNVSQGIVGAYALSQLGCSTVECARGLNDSQLVEATDQVNNVGPFLNPAVPIPPLSPTIDGTWVAGDWSALVAIRKLPVTVPVIMGTLANEVTPQIFDISSVPLPDSYFENIMAEFIGPARASAICECSEFQLNSSDPDTVRNTLSAVGTMLFWTCANQANAIAYASQANVYLYELLLGCTNPANADDPMCTSNAEVCHQDDIGMVFGTCTSPTSDQTALSNEMMARWAAFAANGNPNVQGKTKWVKVGDSTNLNALRLAPSDVVNQTLYGDLCGPIFGDTIEFNFQLYT